MKMKLLSITLAVCILLGVLTAPAYAASEPSGETNKEWKQVYSTIENKAFTDTLEGKLVIFEKTEEKTVFFVKKYTTTLRFCVYSNAGDLLKTYETTHSASFKKPTLKAVMNKDEKLNGFYEFFEKIQETECRLLVLDEVNRTGGGVTIDAQAFRKEVLGDYNDVISAYQYEMVEDILTTVIGEANSAISATSDADPVISFFTMVFVDLLGLDKDSDEEEFSSVIAQMMGNRVFSFLGKITVVLENATSKISLAKAREPYEDKCIELRMQMILQIMKVDEA